MKILETWSLEATVDVRDLITELKYQKLIQLVLQANQQDRSSFVLPEEGGRVQDKMGGWLSQYLFPRVTLTLLCAIPEHYTAFRRLVAQEYSRKVLKIEPDTVVECQGMLNQRVHLIITIL